ncbi:hypothetical protein ACOMHN_027725 [Nucella lapillus]
MGPGGLLTGDQGDSSQGTRGTPQGLGEAKLVTEDEGGSSGIRRGQWGPGVWGSLYDTSEVHGYGGRCMTPVGSRGLGVTVGPQWGPGVSVGP